MVLNTCHSMYILETVKEGTQSRIAVPRDQRELVQKVPKRFSFDEWRHQQIRTRKAEGGCELSPARTQTVQKYWARKTLPEELMGPKT